MPLYFKGTGERALESRHQISSMRTAKRARRKAAEQVDYFTGLSVSDL